MTKILPGHQIFNLPDSKWQKLPAMESEGKSFAEVLKGMIDETNSLQQDAIDLAQKFSVGEIADIHEVMIAAEKAGVSFELVMEIRNKLVEAYQEFMRMQV